MVSTSVVLLSPMGVVSERDKSNITDESIGTATCVAAEVWETTMIFCEEPSVCEAQRSTHVQSLPRRTIIAAMTLLVAIAAAALVPASNHTSSPSDRFVLACGSTPGPCINHLSGAALSDLRT